MSESAPQITGTPVEVWAPAFLPVLHEWTIGTTQAEFRDDVLCKLCERPVAWTRRAEHLQRHLDELEAYAAERRPAIYESPVDGQPGSPRRPKGGTMTANATQTTAAPAVPDEVVDRIVKEIRAGKGLSTVAKGLNEDPAVKTPGKAKEWTPQYVRSVYLRKTGEKGIKSVRTKSPLKRSAKPAAAKAPAAANKPAAEADTKGSASTKDEQAKPDPKPASAKRGSAKKEPVPA